MTRRLTARMARSRAPAGPAKRRRLDARRFQVEAVAHSHRLCQLQQLGAARGLVGEVLPGRVAGESCHLSSVASSRSGPWRRPLRRPWRPARRRLSALVVPNASSSAPTAMIAVLLVLRQRVEDQLGHQQRLEHEAEDLPRPVVRCFAISSRRNEIGWSRRSWRVHRAGLHGRVELVRRQRQHRGAGAPSASGPSRAAAAHLHALGVLGHERSACRGGDAAGLPDPGDEDDALLGHELRSAACRLGASSRPSPARRSYERRA